MAHNASKMAQFVTLMFHARTIAHLNHLKTKSFAKHKALADFYEAVVDPVDAIVESYQGKYGLITDYPTDYELASDPLGDLEMRLKWIEANRKAICDDSYIQNQIDGVVELLCSTIYKLKFLS